MTKNRAGFATENAYTGLNSFRPLERADYVQTGMELEQDECKQNIFWTGLSFKKEHVHKSCKGKMAAKVVAVLNIFILWQFVPFVPVPTIPCKHGCNFQCSCRFDFVPVSCKRGLILSFLMANLSSSLGTVSTRECLQFY